MELKWTRKKPTVDGYYWYKGINEWDHKLYTSIVRVETDSQSMFAYFSEDDYFSVPDSDGEWAGPIPEPV